ncbi:MAG: serine/threonine-protein kinase [Cyanobacteria bacterium P01_A01_bin.84]
MIKQLLQERYEIQEQLGKNPGRKTLLAKDLETQNLVVVKLLSFGDDFEWQDLKLFEREAQILQQLSHAAIPSYLDSFKVILPNSQSFAIVQNYIPAKSLEAHLQAGRTFNEADVKQIGKAILEVLVYLHTQQPPVIHRDIKPSNILLGERSGNSPGEVYLVDFGSVKNNLIQPGGTMTVVGTYGYMPPEQFSGRATPVSDLYALGATLIYLLTKTHPADLLEDDIEIKFEEFVHLSSEFTHWLKWLIQPSRKRRPKSAKAALEELLNPTNITNINLNLNSNLNIYSNTAISKPVGSKIHLKKNPKKIEIIIPPAGLSIGTLASGMFAILWLSIVGTIILSTSGMVLFLVFPLIHVGVGILLLLNFLFNLLGYTRLCIDEKKISLTYELFGLKYSRPHPSQRQNICKVEIVGRTINKRAKGKPEIPPRLIVWSGTRKYEIGNTNNIHNMLDVTQKSITSPELDWLATELGDWLELPISRE